jgi:lipopolysaccharide transport system permease protein
MSAVTAVRDDLAMDVEVQIDPRRRWGFDVAELVQYRELLYFLTWRDLKVRYKHTVLGAAWAVLQPLLTMVVFTIFFGRLAGVPSDGLPYPVFSYTGMLIWTYFATALTAASASLIGHSGLLTKVYFPRPLIPASAAVGGLVDYAIGFAVLVPLMLWYGAVPGASIVLIIPITALVVVLVLGLGMWLAALTVLYRDVRYALPFLVQLWMFATPIVYPLSIVPERWRWVAALNPMAGLVEAFRAALLGRPIPWLALGIATVMTVLAFVAGLLFFRRMEQFFADVV